MCKCRCGCRSERDCATMRLCYLCNQGVHLGPLPEIVGMTIEDIDKAARKTGYCPHGTDAFDVLCCPVCVPVIQAYEKANRDDA